MFWPNLVIFNPVTFTANSIGLQVIAKIDSIINIFYYNCVLYFNEFYIIGLKMTKLGWNMDHNKVL